MLFDLKNFGETYQWLVNHMFVEEIERTMEVYVDDIIVKSERREDLLGYLAHTLAVL